METTDVTDNMGKRGRMMICQQCKNPVPAGSAACPHCGAPAAPAVCASPVGSGGIRAEDTRLQHILSLGIGLAFSFVVNWFGSLLAVQFLGQTAVAAVSVIGSVWQAVTLFIFVMGVILALVSDKQVGKNQAKLRMAARIFFPVCQGLLILAGMFFGGPLTFLYVRSSEVAAMTIPAFRVAVIFTALISVICIVIGILKKRCSLFFMYLIQCISFVISLSVMIIGVRYLGLGVVAIGIGFGILQPAAVLLPSVGNWNKSDGNVRSPASTAGKTDAASTAVICPRCRIVFPAGKYYCDQCGAALYPLVSTNSDPSICMWDAPSGGFAAFGFVVPLAGLILYLSWKKRFPLRAISAGKGAIAGVITGTGWSVLCALLAMAF